MEPQIKVLGLKWLPVAELGEVDKVPAHHVGEVGHSWREDRLHPEASDLFINIAGGFDLETRHFHIHHFVLKGENEEKLKVHPSPAMWSSGPWLCQLSSSPPSIGCQGPKSQAGLETSTSWNNWYSAKDLCSAWESNLEGSVYIRFTFFPLGAVHRCEPQEWVSSPREPSTARSSSAL